MTPVKQTTFHDKDKGIRGNCLVACLASLFDKQIDEVPPLNLMGADWISAFMEFLHSQGYEYTGHGTPKELIEFKGYSIVCGISPRGVQHSVIYKDGQPFFDPHPSNEFILNPEYFYWIEKMDEMEAKL